MPDKPAQSPVLSPLLKQFAFFLLIASALVVYMKNAGERLYWPYMLTAYALGVFVWWREMRAVPVGARKGLLQYLFPREIWLHPSAVNDCAMALINAVILLVIYGSVVINPNTLMLLAKKAAFAFTVFEHHKDKPGQLPVLLYTVVSFLLSDLFYYISHRLSHRVGWMWEFHKVHHSAEVMTPVTLYRMHPFDFWQNSVFRAVGLSLASLIFIFFYPGTWNVITMGSVNVAIFAANVVGANLRHSHIWLSFGPVIEHVILSPAQHQIHHSGSIKHSNKNYASLLTIWDWMFGSLYVPQGKEEVSFGLGTAKLNKPYETLWGMYFHPFKKIFAR